MKLVIVSGLSGAGKTVALHSLEDRGAYCIDNLPVNLLPAIAEQTGNLATTYPCIAIGVDARNIGLQDVPGLLSTLHEAGVSFEILFLEASNEVLIKRFSETRRKHPLTSQSRPLGEAIQYERALLEPLSSCADLRIDTSYMHLHQLRSLVTQRVGLQATQNMSVLFQSFGFKYGLPQDADFVFDLRCLPNPHWEPRLRSLTGLDEDVQTFLQKQPKVQQMQQDIVQFLQAWLAQFEADNRSYLTVALGCTGGQHRSVYITERLAEHFRASLTHVIVRHRELR